jgi:hypothetical protein
MAALAANLGTAWFVVSVKDAGLANEEGPVVVVVDFVRV